jgi:hypothetical protein
MKTEQLLPCTSLALGKKGRRRNKRFFSSYGLVPGFTPDLSDMWTAVQAYTGSVASTISKVKYDHGDTLMTLRSGS